MKIIIIDQSTRHQICEMQLDHIPRIGEFIEYGDSIYSVCKIVHSETYVRLNVIENKTGESEIVVEIN